MITGHQLGPEIGLPVADALVDVVLSSALFGFMVGATLRSLSQALFGVALLKYRIRKLTAATRRHGLHATTAELGRLHQLADTGVLHVPQLEERAQAAAYDLIPKLESTRRKMLKTGDLG